MADLSFLTQRGRYKNPDAQPLIKQGVKKFFSNRSGSGTGFALYKGSVNAPKRVIAEEKLGM
jgi:hypothetical protein